MQSGPTHTAKASSRQLERAFNAFVTCFVDTVLASLSFFLFSFFFSYSLCCRCRLSIERKMSASIRLNANAEEWQGPRRTCVTGTAAVPVRQSTTSATAGTTTLPVDTASVVQYESTPLASSGVVAVPGFEAAAVATPVAALAPPPPPPQFVVFNTNVANVGGRDFRQPKVVSSRSMVTAAPANLQSFKTPPLQPRDAPSLAHHHHHQYQSPQHLSRMPSPPMLATMHPPTPPVMSRTAAVAVTDMAHNRELWLSQRQQYFLHSRVTPPPSGLGGAMSPPPALHDMSLPPPLSWAAASGHDSLVGSAPPLIFDGVRDAHLRRVQTAASSAERAHPTVGAAPVGGSGALLFDGTVAGASVHRTPDSPSAPTSNPMTTNARPRDQRRPKSTEGDCHQRRTAPTTAATTSSSSWHEPLGGSSVSSVPTSSTVHAVGIVDGSFTFPATLISAPVIPTTNACVERAAAASSDDDGETTSSGGSMQHTRSQLQALVDHLA